MQNQVSQFDYTDPVVTVQAGASSFEAAQLMSEAGVGSLVVLDIRGAPAGMLTDRDLAMRAIAGPQEVQALLVGDLMSSPLVCVDSDSKTEVVVETMKRAGVRRLPVLKDGELAGIVALDDLVQDLAAEMDDLSKETQSKLRRAKRHGRFDRIHRDVDRKLHDVYEKLQYTNWVARDTVMTEIDSIRQRLRDALS